MSTEKLKDIKNTDCVRERVFLDVVDSTNTDAKKRIMSGAQYPLLVLSDSQSAGRGRMGRSFYSPSRTGLYMSLAFEAQGGLSDTVGLTSAAAVAAVRAIRSVCGVETGIKWVNDIYLDGKKIAGILCESFFFEDKLFVIVGIGVNLATESFPEELADIAGSLNAESSLRRELADVICNEFFSLLALDENSQFMTEYKKHSVVLGKDVNFIENGVSYSGIAEDILDNGALVVLLDDGSRHTLASGEISLRLRTN